MCIVGVSDEFMIAIKETLGWSKLFALDNKPARRECISLGILSFTILSTKISTHHSWSGSK